MIIPPNLAGPRVKDMVRITDGRMSGTAFGPLIVNAAPEAAVRGSLALVRNGDLIQLDVERRLLNIAVRDAELTGRSAELTHEKTVPPRGYEALYRSLVQSADRGCHFDFLTGPVITGLAKDAVVSAGLLIAPCGGGDYATPSPDEHRHVVEAASRGSDGTVAIVAGVAGTDYRLASRPAENARKAGAVPIMFPPLYYYPPNEGVIVGW